MKKNKFASFVILIGLALVAVTNKPLLAQEDVRPNNPFGVIESYEDPGKADSLGISWTRVRFQWADVQAKGADSWEPVVTDELINAEIDAGHEVVGLLIGIPEWARGEDDLPDGLYLPHDDPANTWAQFVREAVGRYEGRIEHWIIWNEPDISDPETPGHTWDGNVVDFIQLLRVAYLVAKETNPKVVIHLPAITYFWDPEYLDEFFDALVLAPDAVQNEYFFDVATTHLYFQPTAVYDLIQLFYEKMHSRGITDKTVWLVETNAPPIDDPYWLVEEWTLSVSLTEQAAFMPQALVSAMAAGAERIAIYKLKDTPGDKEANPEPFGLVHRDGSRRPAFDTYREAIAQLSGTTAVTRDRWDEIGQFQVYQPEQIVTVLFSRLPQPQMAMVPALVEQAVVIDMWGRRLDDIVANNNLFTLELPGAQCTQSIGDYCMIGGTAYYLIQNVSVAPPLPTVTWTPTPIPTNTPTPIPSAVPTETVLPPPTPIITPASTAANSIVMSTESREPTPIPANRSVTSEKNENIYWGFALIGLALVVLFARWLWFRVVR